MTSRLSDQRSIVKDGAAPLPLYTCVNVKKDISARVFQGKRPGDGQNAHGLTWMGKNETITIHRYQNLAEV